MSIFATAKKISPVSSSAANEYDQQQDIIQKDVKQALIKLNSIHGFMGNSPLEVMADNHYHYTLLMSSVFQLNNYTLLAKMLVWIYRTYRVQGFEYDYFPYAFSEWRKAVALTMSPVNAAQIDRVYQWVVAQHSELIQLAESADYQVFPNKNLGSVASNFVIHLLHGEYQACVAIGVTYLDEVNDLASFYVEVIGASMYEVGRLWETGYISVAQGHLVTAIVARVMLTLAPRAGLLAATSPKAIIATAPNELHELGARMVADLFEHHGWEVDYLGANVPQGDLLEYLQANKPYVLGLSVVMPCNLVSVRDIINSIRRDTSISDIKIMVGGASFAHSEDLWQQVCADAYAVDGHVALETAQRWWEQQCR